jgi:CMP-N,N'-diacetyllegionaminic acid synthase
MFDRILPLIPARGGSKGIPRKNLKEIDGESLILRAAKVAEKSKLKMPPVVSTDDEEIAELARRNSIEVINRPSWLAQDDTPMIAVLQHAVSVSTDIEAICLLQPTNPLRTSELIDQCLMVWMNEKADSVGTRSDVGERHPYRMTDADGEYVYPELRFENRQQLPPFYLRDGACYITNKLQIMKGLTDGPRHRWVEIPAWRAWNIDEPWDIPICEALLKYDKDHCRDRFEP